MIVRLGLHLLVLNKALFSHGATIDAAPFCFPRPIYPYKYVACCHLCWHFVCLAPDRHTFDPCVPAPSQSRGIKGTLQPYCRVFMDSYRTRGGVVEGRHTFCWGGTEWLQQSVSVGKKNLHGNKSYNLSAVCTLDWLRAITPTKKAFFFLPLHSSSSSCHPSLALCQINPLNFLKDLPLLSESEATLRGFSPPRSFVFISDTAPGRGDCLPSETAVKNSQRLHALPPRSLFYLTNLPPPTTQPTLLPRSPTPLTEALSPSPVGSSQVLTDRRRRQGVLRRKGEAEHERRLNRGRMEFPLTTRTRSEGGARPLLVII